MNALKFTVISMCFAMMCSAQLAEPGSVQATISHAGKASLRFKVKNGDGKAVRNVTISIAATQQDLAADKFLATKLTDEAGQADFGSYDPGGYCYQADVSKHTPYHKESTLVLEAGKDGWIELIIND